MKNGFIVSWSLALLLSVASLFANPGAMKIDVIETAMEEGSFNTLVTAIQAAGLEETLKSEGPFTFFAPTNKAFSRII